jgi:sugar O-acyltransferase (sialic acid O-acetyltransferase NeuD family)
VTDARPRRPLVVLGTTRFSEAVAETAEIAGFEVACFVENLARERCAETPRGLPVRWIDEVAALAETHDAICGLGTTRRSIFIEQVAALGFGFATVVHPTAYVAPSTTVGKGVYIGPRVAISSSSLLGDHVIVLQGSLIGHHVDIGDYSSLMMGANVAGSTRIGEATWIATGAVVIDHVSVGSRAVVAAGAVVVKDVPDGVQVAGVPARIVKEVPDGR